MPVVRQLDGYFDTDSRDLNLVELRDLEFLRGAAGKYRKLVQRELVLVIAASNEAVHGNHVQNVPRLVAAISTRSGAAEAAREFLTFLVRPSFRWKFAEGGLRFRPE
jgi:hypothetical protein